MTSISQKISSILNRKRPVKYLVMRALKSSRLCLFFVIHRDTYRLRFSPSALSGELWYEPDLRIEDERFFRRYLRTGESVVDVGANIGDLTLQASMMVGTGGRVAAIEAHPRIFKYLAQNVDLNDASNVLLFQCAVGNDEGSIRFSDEAMDDGNAVVTREQGLQVPLRRLDSLLLDEGPIALMKVDVEGFEKFVFEGAERTLQRTMCVYFEFGEDHFRRYGYSGKDLIRLLEGRGFSIIRIVESEAVEPVRPDYRSPACENLIAVRDLVDFEDRTGYKIRQRTSPPASRPAVSSSDIDMTGQRIHQGGEREA